MSRRPASPFFLMKVVEHPLRLSMACPHHNQIIAAFANLGAHRTNCDRGDPSDGYTHIHGPNHPPGSGPRCVNHLATIEKTCGTVSLYQPIALALQGMARQPVPIGQHPMGHSTGAEFGNFGYGFDALLILVRWGSFDDFAKVVIGIAQKHNRW